jgi:hypothetical protein
MANLSNINNKFLVTTGGNVLIGQTSAVGSSIFQVTGNSTFGGNVDIGPDALDIQIKAASNNSGTNLIYLRGNAVGDKAEISLNHYGSANMFIGVVLLICLLVWEQQQLQ